MFNHLFCMNAIKSFSKYNDELQGRLNSVKYFSYDVGIDFGLYQCVNVTIKTGSVIEIHSRDLDLFTVFRELEQGDAYKQLRVSERDGIQHTKMREKMRKEYNRRVCLVVKTKLDSQERILYINDFGYRTGGIQFENS